MANGCCDEDPIVKVPLDELRGKRSGSKTKFTNLVNITNPIPGEIEDDSKISKFFSEYKLVPYAGSDNKTGQSLLLWELMLAQLSETANACIRKTTAYVIGSRAKFVRAEDPEYDPGTETTEMTASESATYEQALKERVEFSGGVRKFHKNVSNSYQKTGDAFVELVIAEFEGQKKAVVKNIKRTHAMYKLTKKDAPRVLAISPVWTSEYLKENAPRLVPIYPLFVKGENGEIRTVFLLKAGEGNWYGRPESSGSDLYKYQEAQDAIYKIKQASANFLGQIIIEVEDDGEDNPGIDNEDAQKAGFDSFADRMEYNYTHKSEDPSGVIVTSRPYGSKPMFVFQIKPNTNENWYKVNSEISEQKILRSYNLSLRFMGFDASNGFSQEAFISDYVMNVEPVIKEMRATIMGFTNGILTAIWKEIGMEQLNDFSITFESPISKSVKEYKDAQGNNNQNGNNNISNSV